MNYMSDYQIVTGGDIVLHYQENSLKYSSQIEEKISQIWENELKKKNPNIFNDKVLSFLKISEKNNQKIIDVTYVDYKTILADRKDSSLSLNVNQIGVSGITILKENNQVLFSQRAPTITEYLGYFELVPSGNLDTSVLENDGTINFKSKIISEFEEETGLSKKSINNLKTLCLVKDNINHVYDVCCLLEIDINEGQLESSFNKVSEYEKPIFVPVKELSEFSKKNSDKLVPTSKAIIDYYLKNKS